MGVFGEGSGEALFAKRASPETLPAAASEHGASDGPKDPLTPVDPARAISVENSRTVVRFDDFTGARDRAGF
jgi:hypothetical protein